ncbi:MAG: ABC transporter permease [Wenzhouxiangellaceae bacterium]
MLSGLHKKLLRETWQMRTQVAAIALVIAGGMATWMIALTTIDSLQLSRDRFYQQYRFAELFAPLKRAPESVLQRILDIEGVVQAESRIVTSASLTLANFDEPVTALIHSIPDAGEPILNRLFLRSGSLPAEEQHNAVVIAEPFAQAHQLQIGDRFRALIKGRSAELLVSGIGLSPEYVYQIRPGALFPDHQRYAILWMRRQSLAEASDMQGAFNHVLASLAWSATPEQVIEQIDSILAPWGGTGAYPRKDQTSHNYLQQEMAQLHSMARVVPVIFIAVAAFLLNVVIGRIIQQQREQIAILKAFGYHHATITGHYLTMVLLILLIGIVPGVMLGAWLGEGLAVIYQDFFRFPTLDYRIHPNILGSGVAIIVAAAMFGCLRSLAAAFALSPAEGMRPEPPPRYHRTLLERLGISRLLDQPTRMILRHLERRPGKAVLTILGVAMGTAILVVGQFQEDTIDYMLDVQFAYASREDLTVTFIEPTSRQALHEIEAMPGVVQAEPFRAIAVELQSQHRRYRSVIQAYSEHAVLHRIVDSSLQPLQLPEQGLILTDWLAAELHLQPGDHVTVKVLEAAQPVREVLVSGLASEFVGVSGYMHLDSLNRLMREGGAISGAFLLLDDLASLPAVHAALRDLPRVAGSSLRTASIDSFKDTMGENLLIFSLINTLLAAVIAFGVVYNTVRMALAERGHELASLRVLGFTRAEASYILLGELAIITLIAIPLGLWIGYGLCRWLAISMASEFYRIPAIIHADSYGFAAVVILVAAVLSALTIAHRIYRLDLISVLKTPD